MHRPKPYNLQPLSLPNSQAWPHWPGAWCNLPVEYAPGLSQKSIREFYRIVSHINYGTPGNEVRGQGEEIKLAPNWRNATCPQWLPISKNCRHLRGKLDVSRFRDVFVVFGLIQILKVSPNEFTKKLKAISVPQIVNTPQPWGHVLERISRLAIGFWIGLECKSHQRIRSISISPEFPRTINW